LPPLSEVTPLFSEIWRSRRLTNFGPVSARLEASLVHYTETENAVLVSNGTLGLMAALLALGVSGEVVTTPFSFVATANAIRLTGAEPVFADVDPVTLNLDPAAVERAITPKTTAILAVHCFGVPCDTEGLGRIARKHGLALIYDAAHAFGVTDDGGSVMRHGDVSVTSFHATKAFSTCEGGAAFCADPALAQRIRQLCNHGIVDETNVQMAGLNAKMSELHAAVGLCQLPYLKDDIAARRRVAQRYEEGLKDVAGLRFVCPTARSGQNHYAFPILIDEAHHRTRDGLFAALRAEGIIARRYFYPAISDLAPYRDAPSAADGAHPIAREAADRILCLPIFPDFDASHQARLIEIIRSH